jgi:hypothetical protein
MLVAVIRLSKPLRCCAVLLQVGGVEVPKLLPFSVWGDVGSDLPEVDNFSEVGDTCNAALT